MTRTVIGTGLAALFFGVGLWAADTKSGDKSPSSDESPIVAKSREKLNTKITVDFKDTHLKDCVKELETLIEVKFYYAMGVTNPVLTYAAKDKPAKEVLDGLFKINGLGYIIHRKTKEGDRYEGWIQVVQGDERGDEAGNKDATPVKAPAKTPAKTPPKTDPPVPDDEKAEKLAQSKFKQAKSFLADGQPNDAKDFCEQIIQKYPKTKAAAEAKELLEKLKKK